MKNHTLIEGRYLNHFDEESYKENIRQFSVLARAQTSDEKLLTEEKLERLSPKKDFIDFWEDDDMADDEDFDGEED